MVRIYKFVGYQNFKKIRNEIQVFLNVVLKTTHSKFFLAFTEAVCNAAKYANATLDKANIYVKLVYTGELIQINIKGDTKRFNALDYRAHLKHQIKEKKASNITWGDFTKNNISGRGIWYILSGCDFVLFEKDMKEIKLFLNVPLADDSSKKVGQLMSRFYIYSDTSEGVVIE